MLKKILFVSYLKNKGIRRICFIWGMILFLFFGGRALSNYDSLWIKQDFPNLEAIRNQIAEAHQDGNYVKAITLFECTNELYEKIGVQTYLLNLYKNNFYCEDNPNDKECLFISYFDHHKVKMNCNKNGIVTFFFLFVLFYSAFWLVCLLKFLKNMILWIYRGFKENS